MSRPGDQHGDKTPSLTVSHIFGELVWLMTQSPLHRTLSLYDLEWLVMPPLALEQYYLFRDDQKPVGLALWANCTDEAATKLAGGLVDTSDRLTLEEWNGGDETWLVDLIAPFATAENRHREVMMADLITGPLAGRRFYFHQIDAVTGKKSVQTIEANAGDQLTAAIGASLRASAAS